MRGWCSPRLLLEGWRELAGTGVGTEGSLRDALASSHSKPAGRDARAPHPPSAPVHLRRSAGGQVLEQLDKSAHGRSGAALGGVPVGVTEVERGTGDVDVLSLIHISEPTRLLSISYA